MAAATAIRPVAVDKYAVAKDLFFNQPDGFPYDNFDPDQVVLPPGDDCGVESEDDDIAEEDIQNEETGFSTSIGMLQFVRACCVSLRVCGGWQPTAFPRTPLSPAYSDPRHPAAEHVSAYVIV